MSVRKYIGVSTLAALGVVYHAFSTREQCALVSDLMQFLICSVSLPRQSGNCLICTDHSDFFRTRFNIQERFKKGEVCIETSSLNRTLLTSWPCRFFPSVYYLSTSKIAIAVLGNFAFAATLCVYFLLTKVPTLSLSRAVASLSLCT